MAMTEHSRTLSVVRRALEELPGVAMSSRNGARRIGTLSIEVRLAGGKPMRLDVVWLPEGWPSDVKRALEHLEPSSLGRLVVAAPSLSPGAIEELRKRGANWMDERGNVRLVVPPGLVLLKTAPPERRSQPSFVWSRSRVIIAEILLNEPTEKHELTVLASRTGFSIAQVSNVLRAFDKLGWTERHGPKRGVGVWRTLAKPGSMLEAWTAHLVAARPTHRSGHRVFRDPMQFLETELAAVLRPRTSWAVTGWAGASLVAPLVTLTPVLHIYVAGDDFERVAGEIFAAAKIRSVESGPNVELLRAEYPLLMHAGTKTKLPVVNAPRLYADLLAFGGRGQDAAQHVRETVIGY